MNPYILPSLCHAVDFVHRARSPQHSNPGRSEHISRRNDSLESQEPDKSDCFFCRSRNPDFQKYGGAR